MKKAGRGFNVVALAGQNHEVMHMATYDTYADAAASDRMVKDFASAPVGTVIIAVVKDEGRKQLSQAAMDIFIGMGAKEIQNLQFREGYLFMGIKGTRSHLEKRGGQVNAGMILGYSRVVKRKTTRSTRTITKSYKRTITRVVKKVIKETKNGVTRTRTITRVMKRVVTCRRTRRVTKSSSEVSSS